MGSIKDIVEAIEARMVALTYLQTEEVFDFDAVPDSVINKSFRIEVSNIENEYHSGNISRTVDNIEIWIAFKELRKPRTQWKTALDARETIEVDLINHTSISGLDSDPLLIMDREASVEKYLADYLVLKLVFSCDYIRDISGG